MTLRFGNTGASKPWAIDPCASEVRGFRSIHVSASADICRQPPLLADVMSAPLKTGAAVSATLVLPLRRYTHEDSLKATTTAGWKAAGFVPREQLGRGVMFRAGVTLYRASEAGP